MISVVGDGVHGLPAWTLEALDHAGGDRDARCSIILNDNGMSISPNVGALSRYFNRMRLEPGLWRAREGVEEKLTKLPAGIGAAFERLGPQLKESIKAFTSPGLWWEELDWAYMGVIDGHDMHQLRSALQRAFEAERPVVVHVATVKGKGFAPAEEGGLEGMEKWHAAKPNSIAKRMPAPAVPKVQGAKVAPPQYTQVFGEALVRECRRDHRIVGITAAMPRRHRPGALSEDAPTASSMLASPSSTPSPSRRAWRWRATVRWWPSTRPSSSAPTTRSSTMWPSRSCRSSSPWTGPGWSARTAARTMAPWISPTCA